MKRTLEAREASDAVSRGFRAAMRHAIDCLKKEREIEANLLETIGITQCPCYDKQIRAFAAAWAIHKNGFNLAATAKVAGVSQGTLYNYIPKVVAVEERGATVSSVIKKNGRPTKYPLVADASFMKWFESSERISSERMMEPMLEAYKGKCEELKKRIPDLEEDCLTQHIQKMYRRRSWRMMTPTIVDAERCAIRSTVKAWYKDKQVQKALNGVHPALFYNADETQICQRGARPGKSASRNRKRRPKLAVSN